jgi:hypothetical protein
MHIFLFVIFCPINSILCIAMISTLQGLTVKFATSPLCACRGSSGQKPQYGLVTLAYQHFTAVLVLICGSLFLSGVLLLSDCVCCAVARMSELEVNFLNLARVEAKSERC